MRVTSSAKAFFEVVNVFIEGFSWGVSSQKSKDFALYETFMREMRVLKSLCRFKMCTDVKDSLGVKFPFPVLTRDWNKLLPFSGPLNSSTFAQSKQICSFDDGDTHTRSIDLVGVESAHSAFEVKDSQMKPETPNGSHATPHFWREMQMGTHQARQVDLSRLRRSRLAASRPNKARSACREVDLQQV